MAFLNLLRGRGVDMLENYRCGMNTTNQHFNYWFDTLFECCMRFFVYNGLPDTIPQKEIEQRLLLQGHCGVVDLTKETKKYNGYIAVYGRFSSPTLYYDEFERYNWHTPKCANSSEIGKNIIVIDNNALRNPTIDMIYQYASMLAHCEVTLINTLINGRESNGVPVAMTDKAIRSIKQYRSDLANGKFKPIQDKTMASIEWLNTSGGSFINPKDLIEIRQDLLHMFYEDCGIKSTKYKKGNMTDNEVDGDNPLLLINISDMLSNRQNGCKAMEKIGLYGVSVDFSEGIKKGLQFEVEGDTLV